MPERNCNHFTEEGLPKKLLPEGAHGELLTGDQLRIAIAQYRCPCERGATNSASPDKNTPGYPLQPHAV